MCHHKLLTQASGVKVYFAHPHSPWERGIMESDAKILSDYLGERLARSGFDMSYEPNEEGVLLEGLIDALFPLLA